MAKFSLTNTVEDTVNSTNMDSFFTDFENYVNTTKVPVDNIVNNSLVFKNFKEPALIQLFHEAVGRSGIGAFDEGGGFQICTIPYLSFSTLGNTALKVHFEAWYYNCAMSTDSWLGLCVEHNSTWKEITGTEKVRRHFGVSKGMDTNTSIYETLAKPTPHYHDPGNLTWVPGSVPLPRPVIVQGQFGGPNGLMDPTNITKYGVGLNISAASGRTHRVSEYDRLYLFLIAQDET